MSQLSAAARTVAGTSFIALAAAGSVHAAALEQVVPNTIRLLYEDGRYMELGASYSDPEQSGEGVTVPPNPLFPNGAVLPGNTGDVFEGRWNYAGAYKADLGERFSYGLFFDQPLGADTLYGAGSFPVPIYGGSMADMKTYQITGALAYDVNDNVKIFGGLRAQRLDAKAAISFVDNYSVDAGKSWGYGYMLGAAYARPEIALRVALTYYSKISYDLDTSESTSTTGAVATQTDVDTPQSVSFEFQTGVAPKTLVFGSVRWVDWSEFNISPPLYEAAITQLIGQPRPLVAYEDDWWTYSLGMGHQITEALAASLSVSYEPSVGGVMTSLGPYDGRTTATAALSYDYGKYNITGGVTYGRLGDTTNLLATNFDDGSVWGAGLRVGYHF